MKLRTIIITVFFLFYSKISAQFQPIYYVDYSYNNRHLIKGGLEFILIKNEEKQNNLFLGIGCGLVNNNKGIRGFPDLHLSYNIGTLLFVKAGSTDFHAYSLVGISFFNTCDLGIGYSYAYKNSQVEIEGFMIGATVRLTRRDNVYGKLKIGF
ncbi:MAG: hypothetical protein EOO19_11220 [Chryseobacterium sp.]|nr:MAG: hypothetical protein EOO19_11220 [Chryseobacterium sp.]